MKYSKIGHRLKLARERKGLSHEQVFEITRIQPSILKDIEDGKASVSPVFLKGFIKTYARFLGLDIESLFKEFEEDKQENKSKDEETKEKNETGKRKKRDFLKYIWPLVGLFIVFQISVWIVNTAKKDSGEEVPPPVTEVEKTHPEKKIIEGKEPEDQNTTVESQNKEFPKQTLFHQIKESAFTKDLLIKASKPLKVYFKLDKTITFTKTLQTSVWFHIKARESIYLRFDDDPDYVQVFYNGEKINIPNENRFFERTFQ